jgi:hypothetical protein
MSVQAVHSSDPEYAPEGLRGRGSYFVIRYSRSFWLTFAVYRRLPAPSPGSVRFRTWLDGL